MRRDLGARVAMPPRRYRRAWTVALGMATVIMAWWSTPAVFAAGHAPTVSINQTASQPDPASTSPIVFDVKFSKPVEDFAWARLAGESA